MSRATVNSAVEKAGIPVCFMAWPLGSAPELPWAVFRMDEDAALFADDKRFSESRVWVVELYQSTPDGAVEKRVERSIEEAFGAWSKEETYVETEGCVMTAYRFTETERN